MYCYRTMKSGYAAVELIVAELGDRSARGIAAGVGRLVTSGRLPEGTRLPTVRELASRLGVSPTTVSEAWQSLAAVGAIDARGRQGTFVRRPTGPATASRYRRVTEGPGRFALDLSTGTPDPLLLPDLGPLLAAVGRRALTSSYLDPAVLPALEERLRADWPFAPEMLTIVDGAMDALDRIAREVVHLGDRVVVEHPTFPPLLDLLELLDADIIGVDLDDEGLRPDALATALAAAPVRAVFLQPRAHNPTGAAISEARGHALAEVLALHPDVVVVEDDHSGDIATAPLVSLGRWLPGRTVHIRSYSKSHNPDLRLAAVGGAGAVVTAVANRRLLGAGWSSRLLQAVLLEMLDHAPTVAAIASARREYALRRTAVAQGLQRRGVNVQCADGINLWLPVADERSAQLALAAQGIGVAPGEPFMVHPAHPHLRVTVGLVEHDLDDLAARLAEAAEASPARAGQR